MDALSGFSDSISPNIAIIDGYLVESLSNLSELPDGVFVGRLSDLHSKGLMEKVSKYVSNFQGDLFWSLNGVGAPDVVLVYVPEGCKVDKPLHLRFFSMNRSYKGSKSLPISNPRVLVLVEKGGDIGIVEEYVGGDGDDRCYWTNSVMEIVVSDGAKVSHSYIQTQSLGAAHVKWTSVCQVGSFASNSRALSLLDCDVLHFVTLNALFVHILMWKLPNGLLLSDIDLEEN